jgi:uncharacterized protein (TIGR00297 family)
MFVHILDAAVSLILGGGLSSLAYRQRMLTASGSFAAFLVSSAIGVFGGLPWLLTVLAFVVAAFLTTRFKLLEKAGRGLQEGRKGERGTVNVLANSLPGVVIALLSFFLPGSVTHTEYALLFIVSIGAAASDTLASEIGVIDRNTRLITTFKKVPTGTDGGVSILGTAAALGGATFIAFTGYAFLFLSGQMLPVSLLPALVVFGFLGSVVDSVLGATLERRGLIGKQTNNVSSIVIASLLAYILLFV